MLKGIATCLSPELLATLCQMGHGDEIVLADAHFPGHSLGVPVLRADGVGIAELLDAILALMVLDQYDRENQIMMAVVPGDTLDPEVERRYRAAIMKHEPGAPPVTRIDRFAFYERAKTAFVVVMTGETAKYGNIILKKGVTPVEV
jgi:L-fucose mutarotase